ncbi:MAG: hypothetical protein H7Y86_20720, partial [Rhizobacter sp.]|nr:hypothetical protein [Ferruginibacter sp.]
MKHFKYLAVLLLSVVSLTVAAQTKPVVKFKPPPLSSIIGGYKDSAIISVAEAERIIGEKIYIVDNKKVGYSISSYQFAYRKLGVTEDEQTGKISPTFTLQA